MNIKNATLVLGGVGITNVFLNPVFLQSLSDAKPNFIKDIYKDLKTDDDDSHVWHLGLFNATEGYSNFKNAYNNFSRSHSSYEVISKKEILLTCELSDLKLSTLFNQFSKEEKQLTKKVKSISTLEYIDNHIFFFENGNCVFLSTIYFDDESLEANTYELVSKLLHKYLSIAFKDQIISIIKKLQKAFKTHAYKYEKKFAEKYITDATINQKSLEKSFQFAIYNHFFSLDDCDDPQCLKSLFLGSEDLCHLEYVVTHDAKISLGYTHSTFVTDFNKHDQVTFINTYKIPLLMVLANWAAIKALSINIEHISDIYRKRGENKFNFFGLKNERNAINLYLLALKSISASLEGYNTSNHPIYFNVIEKYRHAFQEDQSLRRLDHQIDISSSLSSEIDRQRTMQAEFILNFSVLLLTALSIFSTIELLYKIQNAYDLASRQAIISISLLLASLLFIFNLLFHKFKV